MIRGYDARTAFSVGDCPCSRRGAGIPSRVVQPSHYLPHAERPRRGAACRPSPLPCGLLLSFVVLAWGVSAAAQDVHPAYRLKAAFVSKLPEFVEWPESAVADRRAIELCVARPNPFGTALADLVTGETLGSRPLVAREVEGAGAIDTCHVLFVSTPERRARSELLARAAMLPMLTVGEHPDFLDEGGVVNLRLVDGRVRFEINLAAADRSGVRLSSQLLRLALRVRGGPS